MRHKLEGYLEDCHMKMNMIETSKDICHKMYIYRTAFMYKKLQNVHIYVHVCVLEITKDDNILYHSLAQVWFTTKHGANLLNVIF